MDGLNGYRGWSVWFLLMAKWMVCMVNIYITSVPSQLLHLHILDKMPGELLKFYFASLKQVGSVWFYKVCKEILYYLNLSFNKENMPKSID